MSCVVAQTLNDRGPISAKIALAPPSDTPAIALDLLDLDQRRCPKAASIL